MIRRAIPGGLALAGLVGCSTTPGPNDASGAQAAPGLDLREVFPHVRVDAAVGVVELDARVTPLMHFENTPIVWLEVLVTTPDGKPHETLLVTDALPSHVHAALLLAGLEPGRPGGVFVHEGGTTVRLPPTGPVVDVRFGVPSGDAAAPAWVDPRSWVVDHVTGAHLQGGGWVFAGSLLADYAGQEHYTADSDGTLVGLVTFGTETVAWEDPISDQAAIDEPLWRADTTRIPPNETPVLVRIEAR